MPLWKKHLRNGVLTVTILAAVFLLVLVLQRFFVTDKLIPMLFVLGVFLVSRSTEGYLWGLIASLLGVLLVNYAFMFPYYAIDLLSPVNLATALVMLLVSVMTSMLTTQISIHQEEQASTERERMRASLLRAISHDLRTPLTSIYGSCSVMLENPIPDAKRNELLEDMREDAEWLIRMVENLLSVTRIDEKKTPVKKAPTVLEELIDSVLVSFHKHYPGQSVDVSIPEEFVSIPMDAILIEQVLINLLENAVKHAHGMTRLQLTVTLEDADAVFCVSDDGCGIPKGQLNMLFTGYLPQEHTVSDGMRAGMGIGLFVCAAIIRAHGGNICACNLPQGGAAFTFTLSTEEHDE